MYLDQALIPYCRNAGGIFKNYCISKGRNTFKQINCLIEFYACQI